MPANQLESRREDESRALDLPERALLAPLSWSERFATDAYEATFYAEVGPYLKKLLGDFERPLQEVYGVAMAQVYANSRAFGSKGAEFKTLIEAIAEGPGHSFEKMGRFSFLGRDSNEYEWRGGKHYSLIDLHHFFPRECLLPIIEAVAAYAREEMFRIDFSIASIEEMKHSPFAALGRFVFIAFTKDPHGDLDLKGIVDEQFLKWKRLQEGEDIFDVYSADELQIKAGFSFPYEDLDEALFKAFVLLLEDLNLDIRSDHSHSLLRNFIKSEGLETFDQIRDYILRVCQEVPLLSGRRTKYLFRHDQESVWRVISALFRRTFEGHEMPLDHEVADRILRELKTRFERMGFKGKELQECMECYLHFVSPDFWNEAREEKLWKDLDELEEETHSEETISGLRKVISFGEDLATEEEVHHFFWRTLMAYGEFSFLDPERFDSEERLIEVAYNACVFQVRWFDDEFVFDEMERDSFCRVDAQRIVSYYSAIDAGYSAWDALHVYQGEGYGPVYYTQRNDEEWLNSGEFIIELIKAERSLDLIVEAYGRTGLDKHDAEDASFFFNALMKVTGCCVYILDSDFEGNKDAKNYWMSYVPILKRTLQRAFDCVSIKIDLEHFFDCWRKEDSHDNVLDSHMSKIRFLSQIQGLEYVKDAFVADLNIHFVYSFLTEVFHKDEEKMQKYNSCGVVARIVLIRRCIKKMEFQRFLPSDQDLEGLDGQVLGLHMDAIVAAIRENFDEEYETLKEERMDMMGYLPAGVKIHVRNPFISRAISGLMTVLSGNYSTGGFKLDHSDRCFTMPLMFSPSEVRDAVDFFESLGMLGSGGINYDYDLQLCGSGPWDNDVCRLVGMTIRMCLSGRDFEVGSFDIGDLNTSHQEQTCGRILIADSGVRSACVWDEASIDGYWGELRTDVQTLVDKEAADYWFILNTLMTHYAFDWSLKPIAEELLSKLETIFREVEDGYAWDVAHRSVWVSRAVGKVEGVLMPDDAENHRLMLNELLEIAARTAGMKDKVIDVLLDAEDKMREVMQTWPRLYPEKMQAFMDQLLD